MSKGYIHSTYDEYRSGSERSAAIIADILVPLLKPRSVMDVGCGTGGWLEAFRARGVELVHGVDGPWSPAGKNLRPGEFSVCDFEKNDGPVELPAERFDLVLSMEFIEHVAEERADALVAFIASHGDALLISGAIPLQGGEHHVNERWLEYWTAKFAVHGFKPYDALRLALWDEQGVESWYRQNMVLYFRGEVPEAVRQWGETQAIEALNKPRALVHPEFFARRFGRLHYALTSPLKFVGMLLDERKSGERGPPPLRYLGRE